MTASGGERTSVAELSRSISSSLLSLEVHSASVGDVRGGAAEDDCGEGGGCPARASPQGWTTLAIGSNIPAVECCPRVRRAETRAPARRQAVLPNCPRSPLEGVPAQGGSDAKRRTLNTPSHAHRLRAARGHPREGRPRAAPAHPDRGAERPVGPLRRFWRTGLRRGGADGRRGLWRPGARAARRGHRRGPPEQAGRRDGDSARGSTSRA